VIKSKRVLELADWVCITGAVLTLCSLLQIAIWYLLDLMLGVDFVTVSQWFELSLPSWVTKMFVFGLNLIAISISIVVATKCLEYCFLGADKENK
jgi:hypothetical protein